MEEVALISNQKHRDYVHTICDYLAARGMSIFTAPSSLGNYSTYERLNQYTKLSNYANVLFLDADLYRNHRKYVDLFIEALEGERKNIVLITMDNSWSEIADPKLQIFKDTSYSYNAYDQFDLKGLRPPEEIAEVILKIGKQGMPSASHLTEDRMLHLLHDSYDEIKTAVYVNEQKGQLHFSIHDCIHRTTDELERYLVLYPKATQDVVAEYIKRDHPEMLAPKTKLFVIRSTPDQTLTVRQKEFTKNLFGGTPLRFETMVKKRKLSSKNRNTLTSKGEFLIDQDWIFMQPGFSQKKIDTDEAFRLCALPAEIGSRPRIVILTGAGGAGKTHFVRFFHDKFLGENREVFFLSAESLPDDDDQISISSLYDIYKCCCANYGEKVHVDKEIFDVKFFVNDPIVIVDGLEEMISRLGGRFNTEAFFADCLEKSYDHANGKIIITTREGSLPEELVNQCMFFDLQLFTQDQAGEFFDKAFAKDAPRSLLAKRIFERLTLSTKVVPPLFCNLIKRQLSTSDEITSLQSRLDKGEFNSSSSLDAFLRSILKRETKLGVPWPVDETLIALGKLAKFSILGPIDFQFAKSVIDDAFPEYMHIDFDEAVKNFILLEHDNKTKSLTFRYDFLRTVFLADFLITSFTNFETELLSDEASVRLMSRHLVPGSDIQNRIISGDNDNEAIHENLEIIIEDLSQRRTQLANELTARSITSNLFFLRIATDHSVNTTHDATPVLSKLFETQDSNHVDNMTIHFFGQDHKRIYKFDLRGKTIRGGQFKGVPLDTVIIADEETVFTRCEFSRCLSKSPSHSSTLWRAKFDPYSCKMDSEFQLALDTMSATITDQSDQRMSELRRFLRLFNTGHSFTKKREVDTLSAMFSHRAGLGIAELVTLLCDYDILQEVEARKAKTYEIRPDKRLLVREFVMDASVGEELKKVIDVM